MALPVSEIDGRPGLGRESDAPVYEFVDRELVVQLVDLNFASPLLRRVELVPRSRDVELPRSQESTELKSNSKRMSGPLSAPTR